MIRIYEPICVRPALATEAGFHVRPAKTSDPDQRLHCTLRRGSVVAVARHYDVRPDEMSARTMAAIYDELLTRLEEGR